MKILRPLAAILIATVSAAAALAQDGGRRGQTIAIEQAWARATPPMAQTGAAYFTIRNNGQTADRLVAASTLAAKAAELHTHLQEGNVMRMRKVDAVDIAAGASVKFAPGGYHVMLIGLEAPLKQGDSVALSLVFEKAGKIDVTVPVQARGAMGHGGNRAPGAGADDHRH